MKRAVIVDACRTPIGRLRGALSNVRPDDLLAKIFSAAIERAGVDPDRVSEVVAGCANQAGEDNRNVARMAWLIAGYPYRVPALTVNRLCASGLDAVIQGVRSIQVGDARTVVAGGVESMSRAPLVLGKSEKPLEGGNRTMFDTSLGWRFPNPELEKRFPLEAMGATAENIAEQYAIPRAEQDAFALESHRRAIAAQQAGHFADEVVPVEVSQRKTTTTIDSDEGPRPDSSMDKLASLPTIFRKGGSVTAGNSSSLNDGAAALVLMEYERAKSHGHEPLAEVIACANAGVDPTVMGIGPVPATQLALERAKLEIGDVDLFEVNEAFAVQSLAVMRDLDLPRNCVNVNGGAIALGHPLGCSGARILTTLLHSMKRRDVEVGVATLCVGVGQGTTVVVRRMS